MKRLYIFEIKKMYLQKKNMLLSGILFVFVLAYMLGNSLLYKFDRTDYAKMYKEQSSESVDISEQYRLKIKKAQEAKKADTEKDNEGLEEEIEILQAGKVLWNQDASTLNKMALAIKDKDMGTLLELRIKRNEDLITGIESGIIQKEDGKDLHIEELDNQLRKDRIFKEKHIPIALNSHRMQSEEFLYKGMVTLFPLIMELFVMILVTDLFVYEREQGSIKFLLLQPFSRKKVYTAKILAAISFAVGIIVAIYFVTYILAGLINGFTFGYPIEVTYGKDPHVPTTLMQALDGTKDLVPLYQVIGKVLLLAVLYLVFLCLFAGMISIISDSIANAMGSGAIVIFVTNIISKYFVNGAQMKIVPFLYHDPMEIMKNGTVQYIPFVVIIVWGIVCNIVAKRKFMKMDLV